MDYRSIIESKYNRANWQELLYDIFRQRVQFWQQPQLVPVDESMAKRALYTGKITLPDGHIIAIYEVELSDSVVIERNRAGIRNLLCTNWRGMGCSGAFMFCFRQNEAVLRFSYVSESFVFAEDGSLTKESTDTKRFTYLLGEGHRSRTAIKQFEDLKKSALDLKAVTKAFSVEALSDLFFKEYKKQYENIIEFITGKRMVKVANKWEEQVTGQPCREIMQEFSLFHDAEKAVRDYVKKLMGRLVFIQFLQKKGWMGCSAGEAWNDGDKEFVQNLFANTTHKNTFVDDVLEPLFNDINTKRNGDITSSQNVGNGIKIPYLNGGLFEKDDYDKTNFPLPAKYMKNLLDFFASYNFTIDENDPDDAEIGVDPEMLGRIFENLLEDNKDKGAFYTPKEIVQYMCRESLIAYLQTDVNDDQIKDSIRQFVTTYDAAVLSEELKETVDQKLKDVKICDPAIGSGAFPMGLLRELYACRKAIEGIDEETAVSIKTYIIQNNIYGVDIEKGAVDIARLRFWLALIVDEKTPHALPNMDFKIMQGNSLLEQYEGVELSGMSLNEQEKKRSRQKKEQAWQQTLAFDEEASLDNIQNAIREYYGTDDHRQKTELRNIINSNVKSYILNLKGCTPDIQRKLENLPIPNDQFFLWHIYFKEVFDKGGFDIVIGNPPYIDSETMVKSMPEARIAYANKFKTAKGNWDIYVPFYELGIEMLNTKGKLAFITPNKWVSIGYGKKLRELYFDNFTQVCDCSSIKVFEAGNEPLICFFDKVKTSSIRVWKAFSDKFVQVDNVSKTRVSKDSLGMLLSRQMDLLLKVCKAERTVADFSKAENPFTTSEAYELCPYVKEITAINQSYYILVNTGTIDPFVTLWGRKTTSYLKSKYANPVVTKNDFASAFPRRVRQTASKIVITGMRYFEAYYDNEGKCIAGKSTIIIPQNDCDEQDMIYLLAILNAKIIQYYINQSYSALGIDGGINFSVDIVNALPIPLATANEKKAIVECTNILLRTKKANPLADTSALEAEIDRLVYDLYGLTEDEIAIVEGTN